MAAAQSKFRSSPEQESSGKSHWRSTSKAPMATEFAKFRLRKPPAWECARTAPGAGIGASPAARRIPFRTAGSTVGIGHIRVPVLGFGGEKVEVPLVFFKKIRTGYRMWKASDRASSPGRRGGGACPPAGSHGPHQVQGRAGNGAGAGDVSRILRDFRFY